MNRSTWWAVLITVVVLAGAGLAPRLARVDPSAAQDVVANLARHGAGAAERGAAWLASRSGGWSSLDPAARAGVLGGAGALLLAAIVVAQRNRSPRRLALRLLRSGGTPARVARRTGLSQDAIRALRRREAA